jgi:hypothetical protein
MSWRVVINRDGPWVDHAVVPLDPPAGWVEAWDDAIPGYKQQTYETETQANALARRFRAFGFSAATEAVKEQPA